LARIFGVSYHPGQIHGNHHLKENSQPMRLKLVIVSSLIAAVIGAGGVIAIILFVFSSLTPLMKPGALVFSTFLLPLVATLIASIFVYRHTARRRKLQAALTTIISLLLILAAFVLASIVTSRSHPPQTPPVLQGT
jgi:small-conductance mechanosensitive channel